MIDACKTANTKNFRPRMAKWALSCYGGSTRSRAFLSETSYSRSYTYMLAYSYVCNIISVEITQGQFGLNSKDVLSVLNVDNTSR
jgi:hypothetical protein